jgi:flagellar P-ring protein precursor FlgI
MLKKSLSITLTVLVIVTLSIGSIARVSGAEIPIRNISRVDGVRDNQLRGFGIVTGLSGTGDGGIQFVNRSIANALSRLGIDVQNPGNADLSNIAAVMVTATLPPFKKPGDRIDVTISSVASAEDLSGGVLIQTPLKAANGKVYAAAQGPVTKGGDGENRHLTTVRIPDGAIVEREVPFEFLERGHPLTLQLNRTNFSLAEEVATEINNEFGATLAQAETASTVKVQVPNRYKTDPVSFVSRIEKLEVSPHTAAKVVINERTGTVIMGGNIAVGTTSITHGDLNLQIQGNQQQQAQGDTVRLPESTTIQQVVNSLNEIGANTSTVIAILETMKEAGTLNAPLEVM